MRHKPKSCTPSFLSVDCYIGEEISLIVHGLKIAAGVEKGFFLFIFVIYRVRNSTYPYRRVLDTVKRKPVRTSGEWKVREALLRIILKIIDCLQGIAQLKNSL